ncbi:hypothetical protein BH11PSE4_BH11PSE4_06440 [soil metagenome]
MIWLRRIDKELASEPVIKDVCEPCNNVTLGKLDNYICNLFDAHFVHIPQRGETVSFLYDYHRLKRWLLKVSFNSARIHGAMDEHVFEPLKPYIMGKADDLGRSVRVYLQLTYPGEVPAEELADPAKAPFHFAPLENRLGHLLFRTEENEKLLRAVHLRAFTFCLAFFEPGQRTSGMDYFERHFLERNPFTRRLRPSRNNLKIVCDGMDAWESVRDGRGNTFVAGS